MHTQELYVMGDPVTQGMFFEALNQMRKDFEERHRHIRDDINDGFRLLGNKLDEHADDDRKVEKRVTHLEEVAENEREQSRKIAAYQSLGIAALLTAGWEVLKRGMLGWK